MIFISLINSNSYALGREIGIQGGSSYFVESPLSTNKNQIFLLKFEKGFVVFEKNKITYQFIKLISQVDNNINQHEISSIGGTYDINNFSLLFNNVNLNCKINGVDEYEDKVNYLIGSDSSSWKTGVGKFKQIVYENIWEGIDLKYYILNGSLKYDYIVHPNADISKIQFTFQSECSDIFHSPKYLTFACNGYEIKDSIPVSFQIENNEKKYIDVFFKLNSKRSIGFDAVSYNKEIDLIIDPTLVFSTFIGGTGDDYQYTGGISKDNLGNIYETGRTFSSNFPTSPSAYQTTNAGSLDCFVFKLSADGTTLLYSTYVGGNDVDAGYTSVVGTNSSEVIVGGTTGSSNFPTSSGVFQTIYGGGVYDGFLFKLNSTGSNFVFSTLVGNTANDLIASITVDNTNNIYVVGQTNNRFFNQLGSYQNVYGGGPWDVFIAKFNSNGTTRISSTMYGGNGDDHSHSIKVDGSGNVFIAGFSSGQLPISAGAFDVSYNGGTWDTYVAKFNNSLSVLNYSTYVGSNGADWVWNSLEIDQNGNAYVAGYTSGFNFPVNSTAYQQFYGGGPFDAFYYKLNNTGTNLMACTYFGEIGDDEGWGIVLDGTDVLITGTFGSGLNTSLCSYDSTYNFSQDAFIAKFDSGGQNLLYSTYIGGSNNDLGYNIMKDGANIIVAGSTQSINFPTVAGSYDTVHNGLKDVFVFKLDITSNVNSVQASFVVPNSVCIGSTINFNNNSTNASSFLWDFGDGSTSNAINPSHVYLVADTFDVKLIAYGSTCELNDTLTTTVIILQNTVANFTYSANCSGVVEFYYPIANVTCNWNFNGLGSAIGDTVSFQFLNLSQSIPVTLITSINNLCQDTTSLLVNFPQIVSASFNLIDTICSLSVVLQNNSSNATSYSWDWGNGNQTSGSIGNYQYMNPGNYTVTLIASNSSCSDTITQNIVVQNSPVASFNVLTYCNNTVTIQNNSANATNYNWNWGNGQVSTGNQTSYQYASTNNYTVTLIAANNSCADTISIQVDTTSIPLASFTAIPNCSNGIDIINNSQNSSNYLWLWGDNSQDTGSIQNHTYLTSGNYTITLISSSANCTDTTTQNINVSALTSQPLNITSDCNNNIQIVNFSTNATSLLWNWGDGQTSSGNVSSHTYSAAGNYLVTLILSNATCADTLIDSITIYQPPIADFNLTANCNQSMAITNLTTNFTSLNWNWGNGQTSSGSIQNYIYNNPGPYSVTLIAQNGNCFDTLVKPVVIDTGVVATFSTGNDCNLGLTIINNSLYADSVSIIWGDGTISNNNLNFHQYSSYGNYTVTLIAYGRNCVDSSTTTISVDTLPVSSIQYQLSVCHDTIQLNSEFQSATYLWDFGDGQTSNLQSPFHVYAQSGNYTIHLINSNNNCIDSITQNISIATTPTANFTYSLNCLGELLTTTNYDISWSYSWDLGDGTMVNTQNVNHTYPTEGNYLISLTVNNGYCIDTTSQTVNFTYQPTYSLNLKLDTCDAKLFIEITPTSYDSIIIDYGDGTISDNLSSFYQYTNFDLNQLSIIINPGSQCADTISSNIDLTESVSNIANYLPNSFTPNGDGTNDLFYFPENKCIEYQYEIYNRWGNLIFETNKSGVYWDGKYNNEDLPEGVYVISVKSKFNTTLATITILR